MAGIASPALRIPDESRLVRASFLQLSTHPARHHLEFSKEFHTLPHLLYLRQTDFAACTNARFVMIHVPQICDRSVAFERDFIRRVISFFRLSKCQYSIALISSVLTNLGVFSRYAVFLREEPLTVLISLGISVILAVAYFMAGMLFSLISTSARRLTPMPVRVFPPAHIGMRQTSIRPGTLSGWGSTINSDIGLPRHPDHAEQGVFYEIEGCSGRIV